MARDGSSSIELHGLGVISHCTCPKRRCCLSTVDAVATKFEIDVQHVEQSTKHGYMEFCVRRRSACNGRRRCWQILTRRVKNGRQTPQLRYLLHTTHIGYSLDGTRWMEHDDSSHRFCLKPEEFWWAYRHFVRQQNDIRMKSWRRRLLSPSIESSEDEDTHMPSVANGDHPEYTDSRIPFERWGQFQIGLYNILARYVTYLLDAIFTRSWKAYRSCPQKGHSDST